MWVRNAAEQRANAPLSQRKDWNPIAMSTLGGPEVKLATASRDGQVLYQFSITRPSSQLSSARNAAGAHFTLVFHDQEGFKVFEEQVPFREMTAITDDQGKDTGFDWNESQLLPAKSYRRAAEWQVHWSAFLPTPAASSSLPEPAPAALKPTINWRNRTLWRSLTVGMSEELVKRLLGEPTRVSHLGAGMFQWSYGQYG
jgi:hypothetical protein